MPRRGSFTRQDSHAAKGALRDGPAPGLQQRPHKRLPPRIASARRRGVLPYRREARLGQQQGVYLQGVDIFEVRAE